MMQTNVGNVHEYSVSELAQAVRRAIEDGFGFVRVRGELGGVKRYPSGHVYLDLKDDKAVISGVVWRTTASRLRFQPEQGMEVVATGRMTGYPQRSQYQLIIDSLEPAGVGALMALYEERKKKLAAEGLFAPERKRVLPFLPSVVGVVTSPSGAVIRDILHRLEERFPRHVIVWPTPVQGRGAEVKIAAAIAGFNALPLGGDIPRPDVLIVARGGGSLEDLWCFNEEAVARAVAASQIPIISAVGHETDTTLVDFVADRRASTPTAAAEMATPVRSELQLEVSNKARRLIASASRLFERRRTELVAAERGLGRPEDNLGRSSQRLDRIGDLLSAALRARRDDATARLLRTASRFGRPLIAAQSAERCAQLDRVTDRLRHVATRAVEGKRQAIAGLRLSPALLQRSTQDARQALSRSAANLASLGPRLLEGQTRSLAAAGQLLQSLSYQGILDRGFALVRSAGGLVRRSMEARPGLAVSLVFADGERAATIDDPAGPRRRGSQPQKSLFD